MRGWGLGSSPRRPWNRGGVHLLLLLGDLRCFGFFVARAIGTLQRVIIIYSRSADCILHSFLQNSKRLHHSSAHHVLYEFQLLDLA